MKMFGSKLKFLLDTVWLKFVKICLGTIACSLMKSAVCSVGRVWQTAEIVLPNWYLSVIPQMKMEGGLGVLDGIAGFGLFKVSGLVSWRASKRIDVGTHEGEAADGLERPVFFGWTKPSTSISPGRSEDGGKPCWSEDCKVGYSCNKLIFGGVEISDVGDGP